MLSASLKKTIAVLALGCASVGAVSSVQAGNKMSQEQLQKLLTQEYIKKAEERARLQKQAQLRNEEARKKAAAVHAKNDAIGEQIRKRVAADKAQKAADKAAKLAARRAETLKSAKQSHAARKASQVPVGPAVQSALALSCSASGVTAQIEGVSSITPLVSGKHTVVQVTKYKITPVDRSRFYGSVSASFFITGEQLTGAKIFKMSDSWTPANIVLRTYAPAPEFSVNLSANGKVQKFSCVLRKKF